MATCSYLSFAANFFTSFTGIAMIIIALEMLLPTTEGEDFMISVEESLMFICLGYVFFFIPWIGCWAIILDRQIVLTVYILILITAIIIESLIYCNLMTVHAHIDYEYSKVVYEDKILQIIRDNFYAVDVARGIMNSLQERYKCCGVFKSDEYLDDKIPLSCCDSNKTQGGEILTCNRVNAYYKGCSEALSTYVRTIVPYSNKLVAFFFVIHFFSIMLAVGLLDSV